MPEEPKKEYIARATPRIEVIDHTEDNQEYPVVFSKKSRKPFKVIMSWRNDNQTLKVFLLDIPEKV